MPSTRLEVKSRRCGQLRFNKSARRGSKKGTSPARSLASLLSFTSMHMTLVPESAKQAPATNPTYPDPTTAIFTLSLVIRSRAAVEHFAAPDLVNLNGWSGAGRQLRPPGRDPPRADRGSGRLAPH